MNPEPILSTNAIETVLIISRMLSANGLDTENMDMLMEFSGMCRLKLPYEVIADHSPFERIRRGSFIIKIRIIRFKDAEYSVFENANIYLHTEPESIHFKEEELKKRNIVKM